MRKKSGLILAMIIWLLWSQVNADTIKSLRVAGDNNYPPYEFVDDDGKYKGFNVDIMNALSVELGVTIEITPMDWADAVAALEKGEIDVIQGMTISPKREELFLFTQPLVQNVDALFVRVDTYNISELSDLAGSKVAVQRGDINEEHIGNRTDIDVIRFDNQEDAIKALLSGEVSGLMGNKLTCLYYLQSIGRTSDVKIAGDPVISGTYSAAALRENVEIVNLLDSGIDSLKRDGTYNRIYRKWFGEILTDNLRTYKLGLVIGTISLIIAILIIVLGSRVNDTLRRMVNKKNSELSALNAVLLSNQMELEQVNLLKGSILDNTVEGIVVFDLNGKIQTANKAANKFINPENESIFRNPNFCEEILARGREKALSGDIYKENVNWVSKAGKVLNLDCSVIPIVNPKDEIDGFLLTINEPELNRPSDSVE